MLCRPSMGAVADRYLGNKKPTKQDKEKLEVFFGLAFTEEDCIKKLQNYHGIYENNSFDKRKSFFEDDLIKLIWPHIVKHLTFDVFFPEQTLPGIKHVCSYRKLTKQMEEDYEMPLPAWWYKHFPKP